MARVGHVSRRQTTELAGTMQALTGALNLSGHRQHPGSRQARAQYAVYVITTWQTGYSALHVAYPARQQLFRELDRLAKMQQWNSGSWSDQLEPGR